MQLSGFSTLPVLKKFEMKHIKLGQYWLPLLTPAQGLKIVVSSIATVEVAGGSVVDVVGCGVVVVSTVVVGSALVVMGSTVMRSVDDGEGSVIGTVFIGKNSQVS